MSERKVRFSVRFYAGNARYQSGNVLNLGGVLRGPENRPSERRLRGGGLAVCCEPVSAEFPLRLSTAEQRGTPAKPIAWTRT